MMAWDAVHDDVYYYERIAYRNAWIALTQLPMLYLLSMKVNPIGWIVGMSHERINWLHRWVARVMFVTATVHGFHFWTQWAKAEFTEFALEIMPLTKYGFGAWGILLWNVIVGFVPVRRMAYEVWLAQHILGAILMLWLLYKHIPIPARYNLWMAISFLVFDRLARWVLLLWQNIQWRPNRSTCQGGKSIGHHISLRPVCGSTTLVTIKNVHFPWKAGQFVYLWIPRIGPVEAHPYTIACARRPASGTGCYCNSIQLIVRAHGGFSKRLHSFATKKPNHVVTGFLSGPFGAPPKWEAFETLVLLGASTGASFIVPILEDMANRKTPSCVKKVEVVLLAKTSAEIEYYVHRTRDAALKVRRKSISVVIHVAITNSDSAVSQTPRDKKLASTETDEKISVEQHSAIVPERSSSSSSSEDNDAIKAAPSQGCGTNAGCACCRNKAATGEASSLVEDAGASNSSAELIKEYTARPNIETLIREPVEAAWGETAVIVCGGKEVVARTRNVVAALSDERAVHKGTGAQGIYLYVEEYSF